MIAVASAAAVAWQFAARDHTARRLHERTCRDLGFHLVEVPAGSLSARIALIQRAIARR